LQNLKNGFQESLKKKIPRCKPAPRLPLMNERQSMKGQASAKATASEGRKAKNERQTTNIE
jgi:hypothetical protein